MLVVFLHMVVGEMAPKSWAIAHPERSALMLALPFRAFARSVRWILSGLNGVTNGLLRLMKVEPQDELAQAHRPDDLRMLLRQSAEHGLIPEGQQRLLTRMLQVQKTTVREVMVPIDGDARPSPSTPRRARGRAAQPPVWTVALPGHRRCAAGTSAWCTSARPCAPPPRGEDPTARDADGPGADAAGADCRWPRR